LCTVLTQFVVAVSVERTAFGSSERKVVGVEQSEFDPTTAMCGTNKGICVVGVGVCIDAATV
jgi:hypothetical protein